MLCSRQQDLFSISSETCLPQREKKHHGLGIRALAFLLLSTAILPTQCGVWEVSNCLSLAIFFTWAGKSMGIPDICSMIFLWNFLIWNMVLHNGLRTHAHQCSLPEHRSGRRLAVESLASCWLWLGRSVQSFATSVRLGRRKRFLCPDDQVLLRKPLIVGFADTRTYTNQMIQMHLIWSI